METNEKTAANKGKNSPKKAVSKQGITIGIILAAIALLIGLGIYNSPANRLSRQLDLGNKYLEDGQYEEAIIAFNQIIAIDPVNVEAYLGMAQAYEGKGDSNRALEILQKGYDKTGDSRLKEKIDGPHAKNYNGENDFLNMPPEEELDYISLQEFLEAPTIAGSVWLDWNMQRFIEHYGIDIQEHEYGRYGSTWIAEFYYDDGGGWVDANFSDGEFGNFGYEYHWYYMDEEKRAPEGNLDVQIGEEYEEGYLFFSINEELWTSNLDWSQLNGFSAYLQEYGCYSIADLLETWGLAEIAPAFVEAAKERSDYNVMCMTEYGKTLFSLSHPSDSGTYTDNYRLDIFISDIIEKESDAFGQFIVVEEYVNDRTGSREFSIMIDGNDRFP